MKVKLKTLICTVLCAAVGLGTASVSNAQLVYTNDFNGADNVENDFGMDDNGNTLAFHFGPISTVAADADFSSQYLSIGSAPDGNFRFGRFDHSKTTPPTVVTDNVIAYQFNGLFRSADSAVYRLRLRVIDEGNTNFSGNIDLTPANSTADTVQQYLLVANGHTEDITLDASLNSQGNTSTVATGTWALFQDGMSILTGDLTGFTGTISHRLALWHQGDPMGSATQSFLYMDDFQIFTGTGGGVVAPLKGDVDLSGVVDFSDIPAFISILQGGGFQAEADCDCSGGVDFSDIPAFIAILQGG